MIWKKNTVGLLAAILCLQALPVSSQPVTKERALEKASRFVASAQFGSTAMSKAPRKAARLMLANNSEDYYIFNDEQNGGYVVVGGDERQGVLGYSPNGHFDAENVSSSFRWLLDGIARQTQDLRAHPGKPLDAPKKASATPIDPLLKSKWGQGEPYNTMCPKYDGKYSLTGCVPTAAAQVMYYHKWPKKGQGSTSYDWNGAHYSADFSKSTYQWDQMLAEYTSSSSKASKDAVALLLKDVGYAYHTFYGLTDSGATFGGEPLINFFDYDKSMRMIPRNFCNQEAYNSIITDELKAKRPVLLSGGSPTGAHAMVIDGLDKNGFFHINFGWDGNSNDYFATSAIYYNKGQMLIVGIKKNEGGKKSYSFCSNKDFEYVPETKALTLNWGFQLYDINRSNDKIYSALAIENKKTHDIIYDNEREWCANDFFLSKELPDGEYMVYPVGRADKNSAWQKFLFYDNRQEYVDLKVAHKVKTFSNNHIYNGLQDGAYEIGGIFYFLDFKTREATVTFKNDKYASYTGNVTIPSHVKYQNTDFTVTAIGDDAFLDSNFGVLTIPNTVKSIIGFGFATADKVVFEAGSKLETIGGLCFNSFGTRDMEMNLPEGLTFLPSHIFQSSRMTWFSLPSTLKTIEGTPFNYAWNLRYLVMNNPKPVEVNNDFITGIDLSMCTLYVPKGSVSTYKNANVWKKFGQIKEIEETATVDGVKYILHENNKTATVLNGCCTKKANVTIPSEISKNGKKYKVTEVGPFAFVAQQFETVNLPSTVTFLGEACIYDIEYTFYPKKLLLRQSTPPDVADSKYAGKEGFKRFFFYDDETLLFYSDIELHVPVGCKAKYKAHTFWGKFKNIIEDNTMGIGGITYEPERQSQAIYTLSGVKLNTTDLNSLPKGIYIQNGRKVLVK